MAGHLNYDVWQWIVGFNVDDLRIHPTFPNAPDVSIRIVCVCVCV